MLVVAKKEACMVDTHTTVNLELLAKVVTTCEAMGNVGGMASVLSKATARLEGSNDAEAIQTLAALKVQVSLAQERELEAGGPGSLRDPEHPINKDIEDTWIQNPHWLPWWVQPRPKEDSGGVTRLFE
jgi:hypothetical protein